MPIYRINTSERASLGGTYSNSYLYDSDRMVAIVNYEKGGNYVTSKGHEIKTVHYLATQRGSIHLPANEHGWEVLTCHIRESMMNKSEFDNLVMKISHMPIEFFLREGDNIEKRVA